MLLFWIWIAGQSHVRQWQKSRSLDLATAEPLQRELLDDWGQMVVMIFEPNCMARKASFMI